MTISLEYQKADILVLGAGLAGLRAAWAALEVNPAIKLAVVSLTTGPSGSSFANINGCLGMQVCFSDRDQEIFAREVISLAPPGWIDPQLVTILAAESRARFTDLQGLGVACKSDEKGRLALYPGCFSPQQQRAVILSNLPEIFNKYLQRIRDLGGRFWPGWLVRELIINEDQLPRSCCGVLLQSAADPGQCLAVQAKAIILALGGPAPLYAWHQAGPGNPGVALGLLSRAGVDLINESYLQFMWARLPHREFWNLNNLTRLGTKIRTKNGDKVDLPDQLQSLIQMRSTHCPVGHGFEDNRLDYFLASNLQEEGWVEIYSPGEGWVRIAPMAHSGNGGARIDNYAQTSIPGLYAVGECASGMHGANRIGGGMVLATQVFGYAAGKNAAGKIKERTFLVDSIFTKLINNNGHHNAAGLNVYNENIKMLAWQLQQSVLCRDASKLQLIKRACEAKLAEVQEPLVSLAFESGLTIIRGLINNQSLNEQSI